MKYSYNILLKDIIDYCEGERTRLDRTFDYSDAAVTVIGNVYQDFEYEPMTPDMLNPPWFDLVSRTADLDCVTIYYEDGEREFTNEELDNLESDIEL